MKDGTIASTPNPNCPACIDKRRHIALEWILYHPLAGHGMTKEQGKTYEEGK